MAKKLFVKKFHGKQKIVEILDYGVAEFNKVINNYCGEKGSHSTILGCGTEKTFTGSFNLWNLFLSG